jgi:hypothetical protein
MTETIDRLPVKQLIAKVNLSRTTFYNRIKSLGIEFEQDGQDSYASAHQIELIEDYNTAIARGEGNVFLKSLQSGGIMPSSSSLVEPKPIQMMQLFVGLAQEIAHHLPTKNILEPQRALQEAADKQWLLSTQQLQQLIGIRPRGPSFNRFGFVFHRLGREWIVSKRNGK